MRIKTKFRLLVECLVVPYSAHKYSHLPVSCTNTSSWHTCTTWGCVNVPTKLPIPAPTQSLLNSLTCLPPHSPTKPFHPSPPRCQLPHLAHLPTLVVSCSWIEDVLANYNNAFGFCAGQWAVFEFVNELVFVFTDLLMVLLTLF